MLDEQPFLGKSNRPTEQALKAALGNTYTLYQELNSLVSAYSQEWVFSKRGGWILKTYDRKKALFYFVPLNDGFKISLAIREDERAVFLQDGELGILRDKISGSEKYVEGYALQFKITNRNEFQPLDWFIRKLIAIRL